MDLSLLFAGTGGSVPSARRGLPAILVRRGGEKLLFDCGEGTQRQLVRSVGLLDIDSVFITHFHADHWLGLPGMLKSFALRDRERPLTVYGPPGLDELMAAVRFIYGRMPYELTIRQLDPAESVPADGYRIATIPVRHRGGGAFGYALVEDARPGQFDPTVAAQLGVTPGPDFGRLQRGESVAGVSPDQVMGPRRPGRKLVLSGDTAPCEALVVAADHADVLVHEATFTEEESERARETEHSTARQAAEAARQADVRMLALTHLSTRHPARDVRKEARAVFPLAEIPRDFDTIEVPYPERDSPRLVGRRDAVATVEGGESRGADQGVGANGESSESTFIPTESGGTVSEIL
jgi:ribonuclease Z